MSGCVLCWNMWTRIEKILTCHDLCYWVELNPQENEAAKAKLIFHELFIKHSPDRVTGHVHVQDNFYVDSTGASLGSEIYEMLNPLFFSLRSIDGNTECVLSKQLKARVCMQRSCPLPRHFLPSSRTPGRLHLGS